MSHQPSALSAQQERRLLLLIADGRVIRVTNQFLKQQKAGSYGSVTTTKLSPLDFQLFDSRLLACSAVITTTLTMVSTSQPRERSLAGRARPCRMGPMA